MQVNDILSLARSQTHRTEAQVPNSTAIIYLNAVYQKAGGKLVSMVVENYFMEIWKRDAVADQTNGEYPYPIATSNIAGMLKLLRLDIKTSPSEINFIKAREVDVKDLAYSWDYYLDNQPRNDPIYFIGDNSFFIAPQFTEDYVGESGNAQIKCTGIKKLTDLAVGGSEATILIPSEYHHVLALGIEEYIYKNAGKLNEAEKAKQDFDRQVADMVVELSNRDQSAHYASLPKEDEF